MIPAENIYDVIFQRYLKDHMISACTYLPFGSTNFSDLQQLHGGDIALAYCILNDQEPINLHNWQMLSTSSDMSAWLATAITDINPTNQQIFMNCVPLSLSDKIILSHSELYSTDIALLAQEYNVIPVYYWWHGLVARSWFNLYQFMPDCNYDVQSPTKRFLLYCRAFTGIREYRLKLLEQISKRELGDYFQFNYCNTDQNIHYADHVYKNKKFKCYADLDKYFTSGNSVPPQASASINLNDFRNTFISIVAETVFENKVFLTEKICKCFAAGHPFILLAGCRSLEVLRRYGFKTFNDFWSEDYDLIDDGYNRLTAIANLIERLANLDDAVFLEMCTRLKDIVDYNQRWFFSKEFEKIMLDEMDENFKVVHDIKVGQFGGSVFSSANALFTADKSRHNVNSILANTTKPHLAYIEKNYPDIAKNVKTMYPALINMLNQLG